MALARAWRRQMPAALAGVLAVLRLLPRASVPLTVTVAGGVLLETLFPLGFTVAAGVLVGSIPAAVEHGFDSADGRYTLTVLATAALLIAGSRLLTPLLTAAA